MLKITSLTIFLILAVYFIFFSSTYYKISTPIRHNLFVVKTSEKTTSSAKDESGICAPPGCGIPSSWKLGERVKISGETVLFSATSFYPVLPGQISLSAKLRLNHFYINDVYLANFKAPEKIAGFIEANADKIIKDLFIKYGVWLDRMELQNEKLNLVASTPKGTMVVNQDGTILLNLREI